MRRTTTEHSKEVKSAAWVNIILGALVLLTPFFTGDMQTATLWSSVLAGAVVIMLAGYNAYEVGHRHTERAYGPAVVNLLLGLWVLMSGFVLVASATYTGLNVVFGLVLAAAAGYNTWASSDARRHQRRAAV